MSAYHFLPMTKKYAEMISHWRYDELYSLYSMDGSRECISELMNGEYFCVQNDLNELVGFICIGNSARVSGGYEAGIYNSSYVDIGLGLRPDFTGKGQGQIFLSKAIDYLRDRFKYKDFQLVVAEFNERAIKVYERVGFVKGMRFQSLVEDRNLIFVVMNYSV